jgi:hypothetical protein
MDTASPFIKNATILILVSGFVVSFFVREDSSFDVLYSVVTVVIGYLFGNRQATKESELELQKIKLLQEHGK